MAGTVVATAATAATRSVGQPQDETSCVAVGQYDSCASWRSVTDALRPEVVAGRNARLHESGPIAARPTIGRET